MKWIDSSYCRILWNVFVPFIGMGAVRSARSPLDTSMIMVHALLLLGSLPAITVVAPAQVELFNAIESKNSLMRLSDLEIRLAMQQLPGWTTDGSHLVHTRTFANFVEAVEFVNSLVEPSEDLGHHPDITINYNRVSLELTTHDAGGLTALDFQLANKISQL